MPQNLLDMMVAEEEHLKEQLLRSVAAYREEIDGLCAELRVEPFQVRAAALRSLPRPSWAEPKAFCPPTPRRWVAVVRRLAGSSAVPGSRGCPAELWSCVPALRPRISEYLSYFQKALQRTDPDLWLLSDRGGEYHPTDGEGFAFPRGGVVEAEEG